MDKHGEFKKLPFELWSNIHIPFERVIGDVYLRHPPDNRIIHHRLHLRIIYDILTTDEEIGGAGFLVNKYLNDKKHPLKLFFALNNDLYNPAIDNKKEYICNTSCYDIWTERVDDLRDYYGEATAFYFAFLIHYSKWLLPLSIIGTIWFIAQIWSGDIMITEGSKAVAVIILGLVCVGIVWGTAMLETWYRRENELVYEWGMLRYSETEIPLPSFEGTFGISPATGEFQEKYTSKFIYWCKRLFSLSTLTLCIAIVISCVFGIWVWKKQLKEIK